MPYIKGHWKGTKIPIGANTYFCQNPSYIEEIIKSKKTLNRETTLSIINIQKKNNDNKITLTN
jgi:hypothetical protein